jgi:DNA polymerase sigma
VGELLFGFFRFYAYEFRLRDAVVSVRLGRPIDKVAKGWDKKTGSERHLFRIEDPFETAFDLGRLVDKFTLPAIVSEFERAASLLQRGAPLVQVMEPYDRSTNPRRAHLEQQRAEFVRGASVVRTRLMCP